MMSAFFCMSYALYVSTWHVLCRCIVARMDVGLMYEGTNVCVCV